MAGVGNRKNEGSLAASNTNVFAALDSLRKKKKSDKEKSSSKGVIKDASGKSKYAEDKPQVYWAPTPLTVKSWADVDDEDDDDYYATTAPPQAIWAGFDPNKAEDMQQLDPVEESESEDELLVEGDDDVEEEPENESEVLVQPEPMAKKPVELKEAERQLSKKEMKKKELAELDALLADFGINQKDKTEDELADATKEKKEGQLNEGVEKKDNAPAESKNAKKKKKKDKAAKESKEPQDQSHPNNADVPNGQEKNAAAEEVEEDASAVDLKERLKKVASSKKKKSNKDIDAAARAASAEAAARSAKLAAAKKKEKNHYNQQPIR